MFCPTMAKMEQSFKGRIREMRPAAMAFSNVLLSAATAASASCERTAKQMECSEEA